MKLLSFMLLLSYPLTVHYFPLGAVFIVLTLLLLVGIDNLLKEERRGYWILTLCIMLLSVVLSWPKMADFLLYLPPILINLLLFILFAQTLLPRRRPLVTAFAERFHNIEADPFTYRYTRRVTLLWSWVFGLMMLQSLALSVAASREIWSLFTNLINYLLVLIIFFVEYRIRLRQLPHLNHPGFVNFLLSLKDVRPQELLKS